MGTKKQMSEKATKTPQIRFDGYTDAWEERKLGEVTNSIDTGRSKFVSNGDGKYEVLGSTSVIGYDDNYDYEGDFLLTARVGANAGEIYRHSGKVKISDNTVFIQGQNLNFIFYMLMNFDIKKLSFGTGQPLIKASELRELKLMLPKSNEEKVQMGKFFSSLDHLITLHQRKCDLLAKMKKSYLQKMFPKNGEDKPEIRFDGYTDAWEQRKLGDISKVIDPHPSHRAPAATEKGIPFIGISDVDEVGNINHKTARIVDEKIFDEHHNRYDLSIPSIGIGRVASLGKVIRLRNDLGKYAVSPTMSVIQFTDNNDLNFLYSNMNTPIFQKQFKSFSNGSTRQSVGIQDLRTLMVSLPIDIEEQKQIGSFFYELDTLITLHQRELDSLKKMKKSLLQMMFV